MTEKFNGRDIALISLFAAFIAVGAFIKVPIAPSMYITLQTFFVLLSGALLGKKSYLSGLAYMLLGLVGVPVFTEGGGFNYVLKPTFGYIISFPIAAYVIAVLTKKAKLNLMQYFLINVVAILIIYAIGIIYFALIMKFSLGAPWSAVKIFQVLFLSLIWKDLIVAAIAAAVVLKVLPLVRRQSQN